MVGHITETNAETLPDDDLLDGAEEVSAFLKKKGLKKMGPRSVYHYKEALGLTPLNGRLIGSKTRLRKLLTGEVA
jgi:3-methyladenine DNA glycosylase Tag